MILTKDLEFLDFFSGRQALFREFSLGLILHRLLSSVVF